MPEAELTRGFPMGRGRCLSGGDRGTPTAFGEACFGWGPSVWGRVLGEGSRQPWPRVGVFLCSIGFGCRLSVRAAPLPMDGECRGLLFEGALSLWRGTPAVGHLLPCPLITLAYRRLCDEILAITNKRGRTACGGSWLR